MPAATNTPAPPITPAGNPKPLILHLIRKELQARKFLTGLIAIGFDASRFSTDLALPILSLMGCSNPTSQLYAWFDTTRDTFANQIDLDFPSTANEAAELFYTALEKKLQDNRPLS